MWALLYFAGIAVATGIVWVGSGLLETASERLAAYYELPAIVQGAIVVAIGSSFPELSTTVLSTLIHGEFELGVAAIVGSAIFNIIVIPGLSGFAHTEQLEANRDLVYKEAQFYMIAVSVLLLTFSFAVIYNPVEGNGILGEVDRILALIPVALYGLYLFVQYQDTMDYEPDAEVTDVSLLKQWGALLASLVLIVIGVEIMVQAALGLGDFFNTPSFFWGITAVAAGTSIPDAFVSVRAARAGNAVTSIANVLGSNIFDLLVAIPAGVLIAGTTTINYSIAAPMMGVLTLATILLFTFMRTRMELSRWESGILLGVYAIFVTWMGLETFGLLDLMFVGSV